MAAMHIIIMTAWNCITLFMRATVIFIKIHMIRKIRMLLSSMPMMTSL